MGDMVVVVRPSPDHSLSILLKKRGRKTLKKKGHVSKIHL